MMTVMCIRRTVDRSTSYCSTRFAKSTKPDSETDSDTKRALGCATPMQMYNKDGLVGYDDIYLSNRRPWERTWHRLTKASSRVGNSHDIHTLWYIHVDYIDAWHGYATWRSCWRCSGPRAKLENARKMLKTQLKRASQLGWLSRCLVGPPLGRTNLLSQY